MWECNHWEKDTEMITDPAGLAICMAGTKGHFLPGLLRLIPDLPSTQGSHSWGRNLTHINLGHISIPHRKSRESTLITHHSTRTVSNCNGWLLKWPEYATSKKMSNECQAGKSKRCPLHTASWLTHKSAQSLMPERTHYSQEFANNVCVNPWVLLNDQTWFLLL